MELKEQKNRVREELLEKRLRIPEDAYRRKSADILQALRELPEFNDAGMVHCYVSMNSRREVDTHGLIRELLGDGVPVAVPVMNLDALELQHFRLADFDLLEANEWGVMEPAEGNEVDVKELGLVIVPAVGADEQKNRIGYGKGFYDRFLKKVECPKIGLVFECCVTGRLPVGKNDVPLDAVVTEERVIR